MKTRPLLKDATGKVSLRTLGVVAGVLLTAVMMLSVFFHVHLPGHGPLLTPRFSFRDFFQKLPHNLHWLIPFALLTAAVLPLRALQWQSTLSRKVPFAERYHLVAIGAFLHNALPGKLGDVFRAFLLARSRNFPFVESLGSVAVCKLLEFAALMLLCALSFLGPFGKQMSQFSTGLKISLVVAVVCFGVVLALAHFEENMVQALVKRRKLPQVQRFLTQIGRGLGTARSLRGLALALLLSVGPVLAAALGYGIGLRGLGIHGGVFAGAVMLGAIALGQSAPGVPVGMGVYYFMTSWTARALGASPEDAAAYSVLTHLTTVLVQLGIGAISMSVRRFRWSDLRKRSAGVRAEALEAVHESADAARA